jgi:oligopeptide transport system substrate-binding protein
MNYSYFSTLFILLSLSLDAAQTFRFHLISDPSSLDPAKLSTSQSNYFYSTIFEGLYAYDDEKGLLPKGAESCKWINPKHLSCKLNKDKKWSDGSPVTSEHYVNSFRYLIDPDNHARRVDLLFSLKNARKIYAKKRKVETLGVHASGKHKLDFYFDKNDGDFLYKLTTPVLVPYKTLPKKENWSKVLYNGPYKIDSWTSQKIKLSHNKYYDSKKNRPPVEIYFVEDDTTALQLYNSGILSFLRRLPATEIPFYKKSKDFLQLPVARFDYVGFEGKDFSNDDFRKALIYSVNFEEFKKLFHALGRPGCPSMPESYFTKTPCYDFDLKKAKAFLEKVPKDLKSKRIKFYFSTAGGEDIKRAVEWFQHQWKKHLGIQVEAIPVEQKMYIAMLKKGVNSIFRKGIPLDRPSCLAGIENFYSNAPENYLKLNDSELDKAIDKLRRNTQVENNKKLCTEAVNTLLEKYRYIPLGRIHYSLMVSPKWTGWRLNELNQLDLSELKAQ